MANVAKCYIQPISDGYKNIILPNKEVVYLGRNPEALILDTHVSKKQLALKADYERKIVECTCQGTNRSGYNGYIMTENQTYALKNGDKLEVVLGKFLYEVVFEPELDMGPRKRRKLSKDHYSQQNITIPDKFQGDWQCIDDSLLIYTPDVAIRGDCIASFDMDGTLIKTKSGQRFPKDKNDWILAFGNIQQKLKDLYLEGYRIVIFSNQLRLGQEKQLIPSFKEKIDNIVHKIGIPIQVFLATRRDIYRKPLPGMWNSLLKLTDEEINMDKSFFVGDAAGRKKNWAPHKAKDHSVADRLFTFNINLKFYTPEEYFLGAKTVPYVMPEFDSRTVVSFEQKVPLSTTQEVIIMVGSQGSGKSYFCKKYIVTHGYVYINRDELGTKQKCINVLEDSLKTKKSVAIDNTNPDVESRKPFLDICKTYKVQCKCFQMDISSKHCKHNNKFRSLTDKSHLHVSDILINSYHKKFQQPTLQEGFSEIHKFKFNAVFKNKDEEKLYRMFLLES